MFILMVGWNGARLSYYNSNSGTRLTPKYKLQPYQITAADSPSEETKGFVSWDLQVLVRELFQRLRSSEQGVTAQHLLPPSEIHMRQSTPVK